MDMNQDVRVEQVERAVEYRQAFGTVHRILRWAMATGQCNDATATGILADAEAMAPFDQFVRGKWTPPPELVTDPVADDAMMADVAAWERTATP
jgi:hypothetical protein